MPEEPFGPDDKLRVAVLTGGHAFEVPAFHHLWRTLPGVDVYIQTLEDWVADCAGVREAYDVACFYHMPREIPAENATCWGKGIRGAVERLGQSRQGVVVLHHAVFAWPGWDVWDRVVGIEDRRCRAYHIGETLRVHVPEVDDRITKGLVDWTMTDETYEMAEPGEGSEVRLTTDHPRSLRALAWTRQHGRARVFCLPLGHDARAWAHASFRHVLGRGLQWAAERI